MMHEYKAAFKCSNCHWDNDQDIEEDDDKRPREKLLAIDCWHCGCSNEVTVKLIESR